MSENEQSHVKFGNIKHVENHILAKFPHHNKHYRNWPHTNGQTIERLYYLSGYKKDVAHTPSTDNYCQWAKPIKE